MQIFHSKLPKMRSDDLGLGLSRNARAEAKPKAGKELFSAASVRPGAACRAAEST